MWVSVTSEASLIYIWSSGPARATQAVYWGKVPVIFPSFTKSPHITPTGQTQGIGKESSACSGNSDNCFSGSQHSLKLRKRAAVSPGKST